MKRERGQSLLEFALVLPLIIMFTFVFIEVALLLFVLNNITNATIEGARTGTVFVYDSNTPINTPNYFGCVTPSHLVSLEEQLRSLDCWRRNAIWDHLKRDSVGRLRNLVDVDSCTMDITYLKPWNGADPYHSLTPLKLDLACPHRLLFGIVGESFITMTGTSTMIIEPMPGIVGEY